MLAGRLMAARIEAVAVGFLHSFTNPAHERRTGEILADRLPGVPVTLSSDVSPEMREYERFSTACANAYVQPLIGRYLANLETMLRHEGFSCPLFLMLSGGGLTAIETAIRFPVRLVESGPAGGAIFAAEIARQCGLDKVLSYDMGGTTAKICLIDDLKPQTNRAFEVARIYRFKKGSGLPLRIPVIEMVEIGAGGGSIARVDRLKRITVGPDSAGADPGPACYGRGGDAPTVTDADLLLGYLNAEFFLGGAMRIDAGAAARAVGGLADALGLDRLRAAYGIHDVVNENMAGAARVAIAERGRIPHEYALMATGGAAPVHAWQVARKLGVKRLVCPPGAGVGSTIGMLMAQARVDRVVSLNVPLDGVDWGEVVAAFARLRAEADAVVAETGADLTGASAQLLADMRYVGQGFEITVTLPAVLDADGVRTAFE